MKRQDKMKPDYCIYPSLLDAYQSLLDYESEAEQPWNKVSETALSQGKYPGSEPGDYILTPDEMYDKLEINLINSINRCPREACEAADKGTAFNEIVDCLIENRKSSREDCRIRSEKDKEGRVIIRCDINGFTFDFSKELCVLAARRFCGSLPQYFTSADMPTPYGTAYLYGYIDEWVGNKIFDIKTTGSYSWGKFERKWQRHLYPWCVIESGAADKVDSFVYWVVEWAYQRKDAPITAKGIYPEEYTYDHAVSGDKLRTHVCNFIEWLESRRSLITDRRIFGGKNPEGYVGVPIQEINR